jgi:hypothetical protein
MASQKLEPLALTIPEAIKTSGLSRATLTNLLKRGDLKAVKAERRTLIQYAELQRYLAALRPCSPNAPQPTNVAMNAMHWWLENRAALTDCTIRLLKFLIFLNYHCAP